MTNSVKIFSIFVVIMFINNSVNGKIANSGTGNDIFELIDERKSGVLETSECSYDLSNSSYSNSTGTFVLSSEMHFHKGERVNRYYPLVCIDLIAYESFVMDDILIIISQLGTSKDIACYKKKSKQTTSKDLKVQFGCLKKVQFFLSLKVAKTILIARKGNSPIFAKEFILSFPDWEACNSHTEAYSKKPCEFQPVVFSERINENEFETKAEVNKSCPLHENLSFTRKDYDNPLTSTKEECEECEVRLNYNGSFKEMFNYTQFYYSAHYTDANWKLNAAQTEGNCYPYLGNISENNSFGELIHSNNNLYILDNHCNGSDVSVICTDLILKQFIQVDSIFIFWLNKTKCLTSCIKGSMVNMSTIRLGCSHESDLFETVVVVAQKGKSNIFYKKFKIPDPSLSNDHWFIWTIVLLLSLVLVLCMLVPLFYLKCKRRKVRFIYCNCPRHRIYKEPLKSFFRFLEENLFIKIINELDDFDSDSNGLLRNVGRGEDSIFLVLVEMEECETCIDYQRIFRTFSSGQKRNKCKISFPFTQRENSYISSDAVTHYKYYRLMDDFIPFIRQITNPVHDIFDSFFLPPSNINQIKENLEQNGLTDENFLLVIPSSTTSSSDSLVRRSFLDLDTLTL